MSESQLENAKKVTQASSLRRTTGKMPVLHLKKNCLPKTISSASSEARSSLRPKLTT